MNISHIDVRSMLPENINHFFRYQGSLTTPPCYESILWTVFDTPITLSHNQVPWNPLKPTLALVCKKSILETNSFPEGHDSGESFRTFMEKNIGIKLKVMFFFSLLGSSQLLFSGFFLFYSHKL